MKYTQLPGQVSFKRLTKLKIDLKFKKSVSRRFFPAATTPSTRKNTGRQVKTHIVLAGWHTQLCIVDKPAIPPIHREQPFPPEQSHSLKPEYMHDNQILFGGGWGFVRGEDGLLHLVYIPLWDPPKYSEVGKALLATVVIKQYLPAVRDKKIAEKIKGIGRELAQTAASGLVQAFDEDPEFCGTVPGKIPGWHGPQPGWPGWITNAAGERAAELTAGAAIKTLGGLSGHKELIEAGNAVIGR